jgi:hypothetical protein
VNHILLLSVAMLAFALCPSCARSSIWNAGDLAEWVKNQAVQQGCERESIKLEEWYRNEDGRNVWHGTCRDPKTGKTRSFAIPVDSVWKQSGKMADKPN